MEKILFEFLNIYTCLLKSESVKMDAAWKNLGLKMWNENYLIKGGIYVINSDNNLILFASKSA